jgi:hypothetical protein
VRIEIHLGSGSPSYQRGRELARQFIHSSAKTEDLASLCREVVAEVLEKEDASILASVVYNLAMVAIGLRRALELEEDADFADDIIEGLWAALAESPVPREKADLTLGSIGPQRKEPEPSVGAGPPPDVPSGTAASRRPPASPAESYAPESESETPPAVP